VVAALGDAGFEPDNPIRTGMTGTNTGFLPISDRELLTGGAD
jgi:hypothetical protein